MDTLKSVTQPIGALFLSLLVAAACWGVWRHANHPLSMVDAPDRINGFAYSGFRLDQDPNAGRYPSEAELAEDFALIAQHTGRIRTYTATENTAVPRLAANEGLRVTAGAWLDKRTERNDREIAALVKSVRENPNIDRVIVGNEAFLRGDLTAPELISYLRQVKRRVRVPVSTAEPWHVWLRNPELVKNVDFITVHLLPYWEGLPVADAVDYAFDRLDDLREAYPRKKIVIGEVGWPSHGNRVGGAEAGPAAQAAFMRSFLARAAERKLDYYVMEAFDQPWKAEHEGRTGAYWGLFSADRQPKFPLTGAVVADPDWQLKALASLLLAAPFMLWFAFAFRRLKLVGRLTFCAMIQASAALIVWLVTMPFEFYLGPFDWLALGFVVPAIVATIAVLLANGFEFTEVLWRRAWLRAFRPREAVAGAQSFVSIHLPCCNEPPEMVILTLESLARLDYENFEVLVIDNNTRSESLWRPVEAWCERAGARFRFFHLERWPGFKAGALNFALRETDRRAEVIGVVDADYVVDAAWLRKLVGHFDEAQVAVVQAPQAHRGFENNFFQRMCNWEFDGFFRVGMHHRNERNAIIQHGTMTLVRRAALAAHDGWAEWCICEDAELGLRLMHAGLETRYVDAVMGRGLAPADFKAFKAQRLRWAFGAMQILKRRWRWLTGASPLSGGQRYHFLTGWFSWFADALHLAFVFASLAWTVGMVGAPNLFSLPLALFLLPVLGFFAVKSLFGPILYRARVDCSWLDVLGASLASMGLSHAIARGVFDGLSRKNGTFKSTAKGARKTSRLGALAVVREELLMLAALAAASLAVVWRFGPDHREALLWTGLMLAQAVPYLAAVGCAWISHRCASRTAERPAAAAAGQRILGPVAPRPAPAYARAA